MATAFNWNLPSDLGRDEEKDQSDASGSTGGGTSGGAYSVPSEFRTDENYTADPSGTNDVDSSGGSSDAGRVPGGRNNPFEYSVSGGDIVAPPANTLSDSRAEAIKSGDQEAFANWSLGGFEDMSDGEGNIDLNPLGDTELDPTDQDYKVNDSGDTVKSESPTTLVTQAQRAGLFGSPDPGDGGDGGTGNNQDPEKGANSSRDESSQERANFRKYAEQQAQQRQQFLSSLMRSQKSFRKQLMQGIAKIGNTSRKDMGVNPPTQRPGGGGGGGGGLFSNPLVLAGGAAAAGVGGYYLLSYLGWL